MISLAPSNTDYRADIALRGRRVTIILGSRESARSVHRQIVDLIQGDPEPRRLEPAIGFRAAHQDEDAVDMTEAFARRRKG